MNIINNSPLPSFPGPPISTIVPLFPSPNASNHSSVTHSSVNLSNMLILKIITKRPMVTIMKSANPNHPNIIAVDPTPLLTLPLPRSWAIVLAATEAVCCHNTETSTKTEATKMSASAT